MILSGAPAFRKTLPVMGRRIFMRESELNTVLDECFSYNDDLRNIGHLVRRIRSNHPNRAVTVSWKNGQSCN